MYGTSAIEILPRNSIRLLNSIVSDIHKFSMDHNMRLNPIIINIRGQIENRLLQNTRSAGRKRLTAGC